MMHNPARREATHHALKQCLLPEMHIVVVGGSVLSGQERRGYSKDYVRGVRMVLG